MTPQRLRQIADNCGEVGAGVLDEHRNELRAFADEMEHLITLGDTKLQMAARCARIALWVADNVPETAPSALVCLKVAAAIAREYGVILD
jgi:hypothetical protein